MGDNENIRDHVPITPAQALSASQENWVTFTDQDVFAKTSGERTAMAAVKGQDDLAAICADTTEQVRQAYILSERDLGPAGTIPSGLRSRAIAIAIWRFVSEGVPKNEKLQTAPRENANSEAIAYLASIAEAKKGRSTQPAVDEKHRRFQWHKQDGI